MKKKKTKLLIHTTTWVNLLDNIEQMKSHTHTHIRKNTLYEFLGEQTLTF